MRDLPHIAGRLFGTPLLIDSGKLDAIVPAFLSRMQGQEGEPAEPRLRGDLRIESGVAIISLIGTLVRRKSGLEAMSGLTSYGEIGRDLDDALNDPRVRAVMLQIDSFGGEVGGCFELVEQIRDLRAAHPDKPVWAAADIEALSAAYAIASAAERIVVAPSGHVGSIGVVAVHCEVSRLNEAMGVTYTVFRAGERKADGNPYEPLDPKAAKKLQASMDRNRQKFAAAVAKGRGISERAVLATEGDFYGADEGLALKLVDQVATFDQVLGELVAKVAPPRRPVRAPIVEAPDDDAEPDDMDETAAAAPPVEEAEMADPAKPNPPAPTAEPPKAPEKAAAPPAAPTPEAGNVVSIDAARAEGHAAAMAYSKEVAELCQIAGKPALAAEFLAAGKPLAEVRKALVDARANASADNVDNHPPPKVAPEAASAAGWDAAFKQVHGNA